MNCRRRANVKTIMSTHVPSSHFFVARLMVVISCHHYNLMGALPVFPAKCDNSECKHKQMPSHMPRAPHKNDKNDEIYSFDCRSMVGGFRLAYAQRAFRIHSRRFSLVCSILRFFHIFSFFFMLTNRGRGKWKTRLIRKCVRANDEKNE